MTLNVTEAKKKLDELALVVGGMSGTTDDVMDAGRLIAEIRANLG